MDMENFKLFAKNEKRIEVSNTYIKNIYSGYWNEICY